MDTNKIMHFVSNYWDDEIIPVLSKFIEIPSKSPPFDVNWQTNGHIKSAANLIKHWAESQKVPGLKAEVVELEDRTPFVFIEIPGDSDRTVVFYGHIDKMPETEGWREGLGPWTPVLDGNKLYGRGGVDDGYAAFTPIAVVKAMQAQKMPHGRIVMILEATEECGSIDFAAYLDFLMHRIGNPDLLVFLDGGGENYDQIWCVNSLRGIVSGTLKVEVLQNGTHSGVGSGIAPSCFRIARQLLSRIEDEKTGKFLLPEFWVKIPEERRKQNKAAAHVIGTELYSSMRFVKGAGPVTDDLEELILNQNWRPYMTIIGAGGLPSPKDAGNVLLPSVTLQISIRIPPMVDPNVASEVLKKVLESDPPYGANVSFTMGQRAPGWNSPTAQPWLEHALEKASHIYYGNPPVYKGEGGAIGVVQLLNDKFPNAQFIVTGASGPGSNAHVPNESLDIPMVKKVTCCMVNLLAEHFAHVHKK
ncbi:MAG: M20/M25/M40 family metallo-hydrolase [Gammaproteobacteria bacterium]|nr:M20/M25/M40 family metallo-hydrolase [Gammaproteobacteria bacterium]